MKKYLPIFVTIGLIFLVLIVLTYRKPAKKDILDGSIWRVEKLQTAQTLEFSTLTLRFHNHKISGSSECNRFYGIYEITGDQIVIEVRERTEEKCMEPGIIQQDELFVAQLQNAERFSYSGSDLKLYAADGQEIVDFLLMAD
ncbi:MAG TPA: META domain-containing protein [Anaerolineaceae bacterium]|nr:META domain-containing protein [Anaerolineaceae bacterium]